MDIFATGNGRTFKLTATDFEQNTCHEYPYYRISKNKKLLLYAICPGCGNPIQIINLYGAEMRQNITNKVSLYGKHTRHAVDGFKYWNKEAMENCYLYKPSSLGNTEIRENTEVSEEIKGIIERNWISIKRDIRGIVGITIPNSVIDKMYNTFMMSKAYNYKAVNKYNIPYAVLRYQPVLNFYKVYITDSPMGEVVKNAIHHKSKYFEIIDNKISEKEHCKYDLGVYFVGCQKKEHKQYIEMVMYESLKTSKENKQILLKKKIEMQSWNYE